MNRDASTSRNVSDAPYAIALPGPGLGDVAVDDVVEFLRGVVDLVAHGAAAEVSRPLGGPGRRGAAIEGASKVRLVALKSGSLVAEIAAATPPPMPNSMELDVASLSQLGLDSIFDTVAGSDRRPEVATALVEFAKRMSARRPGDAAVFIDRRSGKEVATQLDAQVVSRLERLTGETSTDTRVGEDVRGRIYEANVDTDEAKLRTLTGDTVRVEYDADLEPEIKRLLGDRAAVRGEAVYDPATSRLRSIHATEVMSGDQLDFDGFEFWQDPSLTELAESVGARPVTDPDELHFDATDAEWDQLYEALRGTR